MIAGAIEIQMLADLARLRKDMSEANSVVGSAAKSMQAAFDLAKTALVGIAAGLTVGAFKNWIQGALDAADAASKLSARTGIAVEDVAGLQLAFELGGSSAEGFSKSMFLMSRQMADGNKAFDTLGIATRNADGTLRGTKDVLYEVAEQFAGMKDGAAKTALAMEIFGKSGAEIIPVLNGGAQGLRDMADMAETLGLTMSADTAKAAEQFNDTMTLVGKTSDGVARQVAAQILPALNAMAGGLLEAMTQGNTLRQVADALGTGLKILYTVFAGGLQVLASFGKLVGGVGAAIGALISGDFSAAKKIGGELMSDIKNDWSATIGNLGRVWDGTAAKTAEAGVKMVRAQRDVKLVTTEQKTATDQAAKAEAKRAEEIAKLIGKIEDYNDAAAMQASIGRDLTKAEQEALDIMVKMRDGTLKLTDAEAMRLSKALEQKLATEANRAAEAERLKTMQAVQALTSKLAEDEAKATDSLRSSVVALRDQASVVGLSAREIAERKAQVDEATAADLEWQAANMGGNYQLSEQARLLRERAGLTRDGVVVQEAKAAADEWKRTTESIQDGLTDALFRAFESGKSLWVGFRDTLVNAFKTLVLQPTIKAILAPVAGGIASLFGIPGAAASTGGGGGGGVIDLASIGGSLFGSGGIFGSLAAGAGWLMGDASLTGVLSAAGSLIGSGGAGGILSGLGMGAGALGPIAAGIAALSALSTKSTPHVGGYAMADPTGAITDITAAQGGRQVAEAQQAVGALASLVSGIVNQAGGAFGLSPGVSVRSVFESDNKDPSSGLFHLLDQAGNKLAGSFDAVLQLPAAAEAGFAAFADQATRATIEALTSIGLPDWANARLAGLGSTSTLDDVAKEVQAIIEQQRGGTTDQTAPQETTDPVANPLLEQIAQDMRDARMAMQDLLDRVSTAENQGDQIEIGRVGFTRTVEQLEALNGRMEAFARSTILEPARPTTA